MTMRECRFFKAEKKSRMRFPAACWCEPQSFSCLPSPTHPCHSEMDWSNETPVALHPSSRRLMRRDSSGVKLATHISSCLPISTVMPLSVCRIHRPQEDTGQLFLCVKIQKSLLWICRWRIIASHLRYSSNDAHARNLQYSLLVLSF